MFMLNSFVSKTVTQQKLQPATNMTPEQIKGTDKSRGLKVQSVAYILAIYHLGISVILFIEYSVEMDNRKNCCIEVNHFNHIAATVSGYLLLVVLLLISISMLTGVLMNRGSLVIPFLALQTMDFILSCLVFLTNYSEIPSRQETFIQSKMAIFKLDSTEWRHFHMCLTLMVTCSCYTEVPTYLNLKPTNYITYFSVSMSSEKYIKKIIIFSVLHTAVILYKAFMICCVWRVFRSAILAKTQSKEKNLLKEISKTALPSYNEAAKMESKDLPPPYSAA